MQPAFQTASSSIVLRLQSDALDDSVSVGKLLRTAKVIATKLNQPSATQWIDKELDGYGPPASDLPSYRIMRGALRGQSFRHGWLPVRLDDSEMESAITVAPLFAPLAELEQLIVRSQDGTCRMSIPTPIASGLVTASGGQYRDFAVYLNVTQISSAIDAVRNLILNWSLELEKVGVLGEGMAFTKEEKNGASQVTQQFFINQIGVLGNVAHSSVTANQTNSLAIDPSALKHLVEQAESALQSLPAPTRDALKPVLKQIGDEVEVATPDQSKLRALLESARTIAEGAAGNLAAAGIASMIAKLLGVSG